MGISDDVNFVINGTRYNKNNMIRAYNKGVELLEDKNSLTVRQLFDILYTMQIISYYVVSCSNSAYYCEEFLKHISNNEFYRYYLQKKNIIDENFSWRGRRIPQK